MYKLEKINNKTTLPDIDTLESFRFKNGRTFPKSYIDFAKEYGYGRSCEMFLVYLPLKDNCDSFFSRTDDIKSTYQDVIDGKEELWFNLKPDLVIGQLDNLVPFCMSEDGEYLFWDIASEPIDNEFDIYITDFRGMGFIKSATSLADFFEGVTDKDKYKKILPFSQEELLCTFESVQI